MLEATRVNRYLPVLSLLLLILLAGCTSPFGNGETAANETDQQLRITQNDGISMSFQSLQPSYIEGEELVFQLDMQNTGERTASSIQKELFGASFIAGADPYFSGKSRLVGVDKGTERSGEETSVVWRFSNPVNLEAGVPQTFPAGVRVSYDYATRARASFTIVPRSSFTGDSSPVTTQNTAGPLQVAVDVESPKPIFRSDTGTTQTSIPVEITDVGDGTVANIDGQRQDVQIVSAEFLNAVDASLDCPDTVQLFDGSRRFICSADLPSDVFRQQLTMEMSIAYPYFELQETSFDVEGLDGNQAAR